MTTRENFIRGLDLIQPDWWIRFAEQQELADCVRLCTDGHSGTIKAKEQLRTRVAERLFVPVRAAMECGLVSSPPQAALRA